MNISLFLASRDDVRESGCMLRPHTLHRDSHKDRNQIESDGECNKRGRG